MSETTDEKKIWPDTGEVMVEGDFEMKLSLGGQSITVPVHGWWAREANDAIVRSDAIRITENVLAILRARLAGMRITMIAAADEAWGIGRDGDLPWRCPEDLRHFRKRTMGGDLVMGRTTFEGLPVKLDGRNIHVVSSASVSGMTSIDEALATLSREQRDEILVAGGGRVYDGALAYCTHAEITRIPGSHDCDAFAPDLGKAGWHLERKEQLTENIEIEYWENRT
ncbi:dihydrofolate reductase [Agrobacterium rubi]|nr:dihydrofolate reductase [Agrobacterium rubi]NTF24356.1 dihydrofolate reductase [Agrobacterium rubi]